MAITTTLNKIVKEIRSGIFCLVVQGGQSAGKTYAILTCLINYALLKPDIVITVVGLSYSHLDGGAIRDFKNIMIEMEFWEDLRWNKTAGIYTFANGSVIEFKSIDKMSAHGPRRQVLFVNEANGISWDTFDHLAGRTKDFVIIDFNPSSKFWAHERLVEAQEYESRLMIVTYEDNEALSANERARIERRRPKKGEKPSNWWTVYGLGQIGTLEGNVYSGWELMDADEIVASGRLIRYGLDFGFTNDESAMVAVYEMPDGKLGLVEKLYQSGILGSQYGDVLRRHEIDPNVLIIADSARPEIIAEIQRAGFRCIPCDKGPGSVVKGIDYVSQRQIVYCGENLRREYLSYAWRKRKDGTPLDEPIDAFNHALDAVRYAIADLHKQRFDF